MWGFFSSPDASNLRGNYFVIDSCRDHHLYPELKARVLSQAQSGCQRLMRRMGDCGLPKPCISNPARGHRIYPYMLRCWC